MGEPKEGMWYDHTSDEAMKRIYFSSVGMCAVKKVQNGFVADTKHLANYTFREDKRQYAPYGCETSFDRKGNIVKIEGVNGEVFYPGSKYWGWAKLKSRTAAFVEGSFIHLARLHYCWGNIGGCSLRKYLSPDHPLRKAFSPHFFKTHHTCRRAEYSLFDEAGILFRGLSLDYEKGLKQVFVDYIGGFKFSTFPDDIKKQGVQKCKFHIDAIDGLDLHKILCTYVSELVDEVYPTQESLEADLDMKRAHLYLVENLKITKETEYTLENIKIIWAEILFRVTGYHNSIGNVIGMALDPAVVNLRLQPKEFGLADGSNLLSPEEASNSVAFIGAITQVPCPVLGECWKQVLDNPDSKAYTNLRSNLDELEKIIDERNKNRDPNVSYKPSTCALSVSS